MDQHSSFSLKLTEISSIMVKVYLGFVAGEHEKDWIVISQFSFVLSIERSFLVETHVIKNLVEEKQ